MRAFFLIFTISVVLISCKGKEKDTVIQPVVEQKVEGPQYTEVDSNIKLTDTITIESFSYRKLENSDYNLEIKIKFNKEGVQAIKKQNKSTHLYVLLYPLKEEQLVLLPVERQKDKFDNWSAYDIDKLGTDEKVYQVKTKIFEFSKVELGLFEQKSGNRFGNMYVINNAYFN